MFKWTKKLLAVTLSAIMVLGTATTALASSGDIVPDFGENENKTSYVYAITTADPEWAEFQSLDEKLNACRIPAETLASMSSEELVDAVLSFPLLVNMLLFDTQEAGLKALAEQSDAYAELLKRPDGADALIAELKTEQSRLTKNDKENYENYKIKMLLTDTNMASSTVTASDLAIVDGNIEPRATGYYVQTPNGSNVYVVSIDWSEEMPHWLKVQIENEISSGYPNATMLSGATRSYNCHAYAWANSSNFWMNDPSLYWSDGSYSSISYTSARSGDKAYYNGDNYSAVVYSAPSVYNSPKYFTYTSKWGEGPLMRHIGNDSPYSGNNIIIFR